MSDPEQDAIVREAAIAVQRRLEAMSPDELNALSEVLERAERAFLLASVDDDTILPK